MNEDLHIQEMSLKNIFDDIDPGTIEKVIATTYSFEKALLLPIAYEMNPIIDNNACVSLQNLCKNSPEKLLVFYQRNKMLGGRIKEEARALVEWAADLFTKPVDVEGRCCFHPKIVMIIYKKEGKYLCRLSIASRNLTLGNAKEVIRIVEKSIDSSNAKLILEIKNKKFDLKTLADYVNCNFGECVFFQMGHDNSIIQKMKEIIQNKFPNNEYDIDVISPGFDKDKILDKEYQAWYAGESHAKIYIFSKEQKSIVFLGSANCTNQGLGCVKNANYECMTWFEADKSREDVVELIKNEGYEEENNDKHKYSDSDSLEEIDSIISSIETISIKELSDDKYMFSINWISNTVLSCDGNIFVEISNRYMPILQVQNHMVIQNPTAKEIMRKEIRWISPYIVLGYKNKEKEQTRTWEMQINGIDYLSNLIEVAETSIKLDNPFRKVKYYGGDGSGIGAGARSKNKVLNVKAYFEDILSLFYSEGKEGIKKKSDEIKYYRDNGLLTESLEKDCDKILKMLEVLE